MGASAQFFLVGVSSFIIDFLLFRYTHLVHVTYFEKSTRETIKNADHPWQLWAYGCHVMCLSVVTWATMLGCDSLQRGQLRTDINAYLRIAGFHRIKRYLNTDHVFDRARRRTQSTQFTRPGWPAVCLIVMLRYVTLTKPTLQCLLHAFHTTYFVQSTRSFAHSRHRSGVRRSAKWTADCRRHEIGGGHSICASEFICMSTRNSVQSPPGSAQMSNAATTLLVFCHQLAACDIVPIQSLDSVNFAGLHGFIASLFSHRPISPHAG